MSSLSGGLSGFGDEGFSRAFALGNTLVSTRYCGLQVSGAPTWVAAAAAAWGRAVVLVSRGGGGGWLRGDGVVVLVCPPNVVASVGVAVRVLGLGLLDGQCGLDVLRCLWVYWCGVRHNPGVCTPCAAWPTPRTGWRVWWVRVSTRGSWRRSSQMSSDHCCQVCVWSLGAG